MIGKVYTMPPQPPVEEDTEWLHAGALTIGVEYRRVNPDNMQLTYVGTDYEGELFERWPGGGFVDEGVSIHVVDRVDGHEYLRFDVFTTEPHYHYNHKTPPGAEPLNNVIDFDVTAHGDMFPWVIRCLRERLPQMLTEAGAAHLVDRIDHTLVDHVTDEVVKIADQTRRPVRS